MSNMRNMKIVWIVAEVMGSSLLSVRGLKRWTGSNSKHQEEAVIVASLCADQNLPVNTYVESHSLRKFSIPLDDVPYCDDLANVLWSIVTISKKGYTYVKMHTSSTPSRKPTIESIETQTILFFLILF